MVLDRGAVEHPNFILQRMRELAKELNFKFHSLPNHIDGITEWDDILCGLDTPTFDCNFHVQQMPGCCAVLVVSYVHVKPWSKENFNRVLTFVGIAAYRAGFGSVAMTQVVKNYSKMLWENEVWFDLLAIDWEASPPFRNAKSGNLVVYLTKDLRQKGKVDELEVRVKD